MKIVSGVFLILHGLVHLLYIGQSQRLFELRPGMVWPDDSWAFARPFGIQATRWLASITYVLAALGFVAGGIGIFAGQAWWRPVVAGSAAFSSVIILLFWDGKLGPLRKLDAQGLIALVINAAILVALLVLQWPSV